MTVTQRSSHNTKAPSLELPLFASRIMAGFPSPADDHVERTLDLHTLLVERPAATFYLRVEGDSMCEAGILSGDIVVVDRSLTPQDGDIVIAVLDGELTIKRMGKKDGFVALFPENKAYDPILVLPDQALEIWGVVTGCVRQFRRAKAR
ncbi:MAG: hypothetical protein C0514_08465 [Candidatus Puniceispirillum sp.]|nr:hypothetical protein [Candidatus Puniceispirillum sp.]